MKIKVANAVRKDDQLQQKHNQHIWCIIACIWIVNKK